MNLLRKVRRGPNAARPGLVAVLLTACVVAAGCGNKDASTTAAPKGAAPVAATGETKGTPEQEASKQRSMQQGPSIEAANEAAARAAAAERAAGK